MIAGEYVDTAFEGKNISIQDLEYIHKKKTGALLTLCVRMGAILANASTRRFTKFDKIFTKNRISFSNKRRYLIRRRRRKGPRKTCWK